MQFPSKRCAEHKGALLFRRSDPIIIWADGEVPLRDEAKGEAQTEGWNRSFYARNNKRPLAGRHLI